MFDEMQKTAHTIAHNAIHLSQEGQIYGGTFKFVSGRAQEVLATLNLKRLIFTDTRNALLKCETCTEEFASK